MRTRSWSSWLGLASALLFAMPAAATAPAETVDPTGAREVVEEAVQAVLAVLEQPDLTSEQRRREIEKIAYQRFDFVTMSKLVVARPWRKFSEAQKKEFVSEFKLHLSRSYGRRLDRYQQTGVEIAGYVVEPRGDVTVKTRIVGGEYDGTEVNYRMRFQRGEKGEKGEWKTIDVVVEGVSLVSNFRSQFQPILQRGGPEELLRRLADKNAELAAGVAGDELIREATPANPPLDPGSP